MAACAPTKDDERNFDLPESSDDSDGANDDDSEGDDGADKSDEKDDSADDDGADDDSAGKGDDDSADDDSAGKGDDDSADDDSADDDSADDDSSDDDSADDDSADDDGADDDGADDDGADDDVTGEGNDDSADDDSAGKGDDDSADDDSAGKGDDDSADDDSADDDSADDDGEESDDDSADDDGDPGLTSVLADFVWATGDIGTGPGLFDDARFIAADGDGNAYVAEFEAEGATRVQVFDAEGSFVTQWFTQSTSIVTGIASTLDGKLFILQGGAVDHYEGSDGEYLGRVSFSGSADAIATGPDGGVVIVSRDRILRLSSAGNTLYDNESINSVLDSIFINGATVDGAGNVLVIETFEPAVFKFNASGTFVDRVGVEGEGPGYLDGAPDSVTTDRRGRIFVADWDGIEVFESGGSYAGLIDLNGAIFGMTTTIDDALLVIERNYSKLYRLQLRE